MFDIQKFCTDVCDRAYPNYLEKDKAVIVSQAELNRLRLEETDLSTYAINKWTYKVSDILNVPPPHEVKENLVVVTWRLAGIDRNDIATFQTGNNFEIYVNASSINALNAFNWALGTQLARMNEVRLSDLIGDVEEDEPVSKTGVTHNARAFRVWGLTVNQLVTGMNELFEPSED